MGKTWENPTKNMVMISLLKMNGNGIMALSKKIPVIFVDVNTATRKEASSQNFTGKYLSSHRETCFKNLQNTSDMEYHEISWNIPMIFPFKPSFLHLPNGDFPRMTPDFARGETKPPNSPGRGPLDASLDLVVKLLQQEYIYNDYINRDDYDYNSVIIIINYRDNSLSLYIIGYDKL